MMSISPPLGHVLKAAVQNAGQTPQPHGIRTASMTNTEPIWYAFFDCESQSDLHMLCGLTSSLGANRFSLYGTNDSLSTGGLLAGLAAFVPGLMAGRRGCDANPSK